MNFRMSSLEVCLKFMSGYFDVESPKLLSRIIRKIKTAKQKKKKKQATDFVLSS